MEFIDDWQANRANLKGGLVVVCYRLANFFCSGPKWRKWLGMPYLIAYRIVVEWVLAIEIPPSTIIGRRLVIHHGQGLVVNNETIIGDDCVLRHNVTLGNKGDHDLRCPVIGNSVQIGTGAIVLGGIQIGDGSVIGAGAIVLEDVPSGVLVVGNPAKVIKAIKGKTNVSGQSSSR